MDKAAVAVIEAMASAPRVELHRVLVSVLARELSLDVVIVATPAGSDGTWQVRAAYSDGALVRGDLGSPASDDEIRAQWSARSGEGAEWSAAIGASDGAPMLLLGGAGRQRERGGGDASKRISVLRVCAGVAALAAPRSAEDFALDRRREARWRHDQTLLRLAQISGEDTSARLRSILATAAGCLSVERAGYWRLVDDGQALLCEELYLRSTATCERGARIAASACPSYFAAIGEATDLMIHDVRHDPRADELRTGYLDVHAITSMLDIPVWRDGQLAGVVCLEHVGPPRRWTVEEQSLAGAAAQTVAVALEASARASAGQRYRLLSSAVGEVVWEWDLATDVIVWNEAFESVFGYPPDAVEQTPAWWAARIHPGDRDRVSRSLESFFESQNTTWTEEYRFTRADGRVAFTRDRGIVVRNAEGRALRMVGALTDITERKVLEQRLILADRMASMGTLAAGVAHEINNPLAYVMGNIGFVLEQLEARGGDHDLIAALSDARGGAERVRRIVQDLRTFSRPQDMDLTAIDVERVVDSAVAIAKNDIRHRARLVKIFRAPPPAIANEARLGQVVLNLLVNATQALPDGASEANEIRVETGEDATGRVYIDVADTGHGMSAEVLSRIFDPFFTTKPVGEGTGLGLAIAHSIVATLGGEISVDSAPGRGSVFRVALKPAEEPAASLGSLVPRTPSKKPARRSRVLVIDDDAAVAAIVARALSRDHDVEVVTKGRDARERLLAGEGFEVVVCDVMMPDINGIDLFHEVTRVRPELEGRFVFITGGAFTARAAHFLAAEGRVVLEKPFANDELRRVVASLA